MQIFLTIIFLYTIVFKLVNSMLYLVFILFIAPDFNWPVRINYFVFIFWSYLKLNLYCNFFFFWFSCHYSGFVQKKNFALILSFHRILRPHHFFFLSKIGFIYFGLKFILGFIETINHFVYLQKGLLLELLFLYQSLKRIYFSCLLWYLNITIHICSVASLNYLRWNFIKKNC